MRATGVAEVLNDAWTQALRSIPDKRPADTILAALAAAGLAVVPVEANKRMCKAGYRIADENGAGADDVWRAMVAAAMEDDSDRGGI